jgi:hypothetical protein
LVTPVDAATSSAADSAIAPPTSEAVGETPPLHTNEPPSERTQHVARMITLLEIAETAPEIVDWDRLRHELVNRLRLVAQQSMGPDDFASAATLMIEGKLGQHTTSLASAKLALLRRSIQRLATALHAADLGTIGAELAQW